MKPRAYLLPALALAGLSGCFLPRWNRSVDVDHPIRTTPGGVQVQDVLEGLGPAVTPFSEVTMDYRVQLRDGTLVDSTYERGLPISFTMGAAPIPGWEEALLGMRAGGKRVAEIPPALGYGEAGIEGLVPPGSSLLCEFEMLEVGEPRPE
ncbi:MAG: FKBP-type peptidyl-prolyl cis-trans isomerase [Planctomycetota bacterium]